MSSKRWRRFLRWLTALAQVYISICYIFSIFFGFAFWFTKPRMIDHIYNGNTTTKVIVVLSQGWLEKSAKMREDAQNRICEIKKEISIWIIVLKCCLSMRKNKLEKKHETRTYIITFPRYILALLRENERKHWKIEVYWRLADIFLSMLLKNWKNVIISSYNLQVWLEKTKMKNEHTFI